MLTFRKALVAAVLLIAFIALIRSSHSSASPAPSPLPVSEEIDRDESYATEERPPSQKTARVQQQPLEPPASAPLRDRLRYQFPYDLDGKFPAYIWQTWKYTPGSLWFTPELRDAEASWTELHPGFVHEVIPDDTQRHLIKYLYGSVPDVFEAYDSMPLPVLKADFFRYLILLARGGIYSDIDTTALKPALDWLPSEFDLSTVGFVVGIEADPDRPDWHDWYSRRIQFCQWTIQAKPGHPILRDIVAYITEEALRMKKKGILKTGKMDKTIVEFTGPAAWTDAVFRYFNNPDYFNIEPGSDLNVTYEDFTNQEGYKKVGDVVVLPITSFSPGVQQMGAQDIDDPMAFVKHDFGGTWKSDPSL
ncbi:glycosyltransferase family 32 protein [Aspergillus melleus]|uniref:glycosyltransferase family 32 protein n=1 Tax=Aspergillus melleus TaxID=138277 RepID=UPI001E8EE725|nr:alpha-1,6-mannosyltransferase Och1 [Aspergillus melleus]KAH8423464.1 alpha-1,6-mannosyltransferase Och1 [Aspergillus melleus]